MSLPATPSGSRRGQNAVASPLAPPHSPTKAGSVTGNGGGTLPGEGNLWSSILDSVKTTKAVQTKQCIVLGAPRAGKSSLVARLRTADGLLPPHLEADNQDTSDGKGKALDLGMSYEVMEVRDDGDEGDVLGRLGFYQISTSEPARTRLVSLALSRCPVVDSLAIIVLDWRKPWTFVRELEYWIDLVEAALDQSLAADDDVEERQQEREEGKRRLEATIRAYQEPTASGTMPSASSANLHIADAPLPAGTLLENLGLGLVIVCTKADQLNMLERDREFSEDLFDYVQQLIRTVALRYGAAVFYTSQTNPSSYAKLRQYILHRLFAPDPSLQLPASTSLPYSTPWTNLSEKGRSVSAPTPRKSARAAFPFLHRANVVDREQVLVPTGWDTWGKIKILRERFDCEACGQNWEADLDARRRARDRSEQEHVDDAEPRGGLTAEYATAVLDFDERDQLVSASSLTQAENEQAFLRQHYEVLQAEVAKDPRLAFRQPVAGSMSSNGFGPSSVGPMAGSTLDLPNVASTLERAKEATGASSRDSLPSRTDERYRSSMSRQNSGSSQPVRSPPLGSSTSPALPSAATFLSRTSSQQSAGPASSSTGPATPGAASTAGNAAGGNQVLADFFQSLLTARTAGAAASIVGTGAGSSSNSTAALRASTQGGPTAEDASRRDA
ncbi:hypothetical protein JCM3774_000977 [Rhodotorula dairenensis]